MRNMSSRSPGLPIDEELEAERERQRSRREADDIIAREAEENRAIEERGVGDNAETLRPLPSPARTMPASSPSPSFSKKDGSWWTTRNGFSLQEGSSLLLRSRSYMRPRPARKRGRIRRRRRDRSTRGHLRPRRRAPRRGHVARSPPQAVVLIVLEHS
ncbi:hypothetical protein C8Q74DRAFT_320997 [Fomes fomentarius]|nr:hypothetical protein C8Q74DRAFT_320997 [Fomes fomentarius]